MAYQTGILSIRGKLYNMAGASAYTGASSGTAIGRVVDVLDVEMQRDIEVMPRYDVGSTPFYGRIVGETARISVQLADYDANWIALISQRRPVTGQTLNYHFGLGANYKMGMLLSSSELLPLMIKDESAPADYPALYLPSAIVENVSLVKMSMGSRLVDMARVSILALYHTTYGSVGAFGNLANFPAII